MTMPGSAAEGLRGSLLSLRSVRTLDVARGATRPGVLFQRSFPSNAFAMSQCGGGWFLLVVVFASGPCATRVEPEEAGRGHVLVRAISAEGTPGRVMGAVGEKGHAKLSVLHRRNRTAEPRRS